MKASRLLSVSVCLALFCILCTSHARADQWNQATNATFNEPIEIPGRVLSPGTYWFTLLRDDPDRNIVQIWNADRTQHLATILTVPDYRLQPKGRTVMKFEERPSSSPEALEAWFYPGDNYGHEFVYPARQQAADVRMMFGNDNERHNHADCKQPGSELPIATHEGQHSESDRRENGAERDKAADREDHDEDREADKRGKR